MSRIDDIMAVAPVIPVLTVERVEDAVPVAEALVAGGLRVLEVTLRTPAALEVIRAMQNVKGAIVGAGTVITPSLYRQAAEAGCAFAVSPGLTDALAHAATEGPIPLLPGISSPSDVMRALDHGFSRLKFFPATASGGLSALIALSAVFRGVKFCPTGGITLQTAPEWLAQPSVACVGGSWLVPVGQSLDAQAVEQAARAAAALQ